MDTIVNLMFSGSGCSYQYFYSQIVRAIKWHSPKELFASETNNPHPSCTHCSVEDKYVHLITPYLITWVEVHLANFHCYFHFAAKRIQEEERKIAKAKSKSSASFSGLSESCLDIIDLLGLRGFVSDLSSVYFSSSTSPSAGPSAYPRGGEGNSAMIAFESSSLKSDTNSFLRQTWKILVLLNVAILLPRHSSTLITTTASAVTGTTTVF